MDLQKRMGGGIKSPLVASDTSSPSKTDRKNITIDISRLSPDDTLTLKLSEDCSINLSLLVSSPVVQPVVQEPSSLVEPVVQESSPVVDEPPRDIVRRYQEPEWTRCHRKDYDGRTCRINIDTRDMKCYRSDKKTVIPISAHRCEYGDGSVRFLCQYHHPLYEKKSIVR